MLTKFWQKQTKIPARYNVGVSVATADLENGKRVTITRKGRYYPDMEATEDSEERLLAAMNESWVHADDDIYYNRDVVISFTARRKPLWVDSEGSEI